jgi:tetratricopeptide (TPR) repeat protein/tRNA A-37 threonylcarbamoyl transferase component Bud32
MLCPLACPDESTLWRFLRDQLDDAAAERVDDHVGGCPSCQRALDRLIGSLPDRLLPEADEEMQFDAVGRHASAISVGATPRILIDGNKPGRPPDPPEGPRPLAWPAGDDCSPRLRLFGEIARGGMGVIVKCRDLALRRDLAVKVLLEKHRSRPELIRRFLVEARIAGQLQHPGTVPIHELGALADGRPYFAMKLVKGRTLEAILEERGSPSEDLPRFLGIFEQVCQTVAYAHARGIVHRDLKPANVMVGRFGEVQVMDWGLAKLLAGDGVSSAEDEEDSALGESQNESGEQTDPGSVLGTWAYMPPEQARGIVTEVDRRSDVFGLGAVLVEILTGQPPYVDQDQRSVRLQATRAGLDGAYARLAGCGADAELIELATRCLAPVQADRPRDSGEIASALASYRAGVAQRLHQERLARERHEVRAAEGRRRQRVWAAATVIVLMALSLGVAASTIFALRERAARQQATQQAQKAEESLFLLEDVLAQADPKTESNLHMTLREAVDRTTDRLRNGALRTNVKTPESNAQVRIALGKIYTNLGEYRKSHDLFVEAHQIARDGLGEAHPTAMTALDQLGQACITLEDFPQAERVLYRAYELQRDVLGPEHEDTIHTFAKISDLYAAMGKCDRAIEIGEKVLTIRRRIWGDEYEFTLVSMNNLGSLYLDVDRPEEALPLFQAAEEIAGRTIGKDQPATLTYKRNRAWACSNLGRWQEALDHFTETLGRTRKLLGEDHLSALRTELGIATVKFGMGQIEESRRLSESILERLGTTIAKDHSFRGKVFLNLGRCFTAIGEYSQAERTLREAQAILVKKLGPEHRQSRAAAKALEELLERKTGTRAKEAARARE